MPDLSETLRRYDRDRFLATLCAPSRLQPALWALLGFNLEIARVREVVSQPILGQIRLQWWRDALDEIYTGKPVRRHEVATPLADAIRRHDITRTHLDRMIDAREQDLADTPPPTLAALETYVEDTSSRLLYAELEVLSEGTDGFEAAREIGIAWGLVGLIRAVPFHSAAKRIYIPADVAQAVDLHEQDIYATKFLPSLGVAVERMAEAAHQHLITGRNGQRALKAEVYPALLLARLADAYLKKLAAAKYDPYAPAIQYADPLAAWRISWGKVLKRY
jgi:NADH dehydrogenase [ubiquinone] 1 alpha subcomplex assembly factor 6